MRSHVTQVTGRQILPATPTGITGTNSGVLMSDLDDQKLQKIIDDTLQKERKNKSTENSVL